MKLITLELKQGFRSLPKNFKIRFLREWDHEKAFEFHPYCLAGRNGSGKSNILEALAAIFYHLECTDLHRRQEHFQYVEENSKSSFQPDISYPNEFEIEYFFPHPDRISNHPSRFINGQQVVHINISKKKRKPPQFSFVRLNVNEGRLLVPIPESEINDFLPAFVLGYSSGHNEILHLPFSKMRFVHLDEYKNTLSRDLIYDGQPTGRSIFIDDQFSQAVLLCHYLFPTDPVLRIFKRETKLTGIRCFRIIIRRFHRISFSEEITGSLNKDEKDDINKTSVELTSKLDLPSRHFREGLINAFIKCATSCYEDRSNYVNPGDEESYDLILDYWIEPYEDGGYSAIREAFMFHFGELETEDDSKRIADASLKLFRALQTLLTLNYYQTKENTKVELYDSNSLYASETIPVPASDDRIMRFKDFELVKEGVESKLYGRALSDGEYQLLHTIGLCLLFRHKPCLFLLDEPETHLNPDWRASYISILRESFRELDEKIPVMREVLLTSHSPFIISDCQQDNVLVFEKDEKTGTVSYARPTFNTFGASANKITIKIFGQGETIGDYAFAQLKKLRARLEAGESPEELVEEANQLLGDSVEKVLFVNEAIHKEAKE